MGAVHQVDGAPLFDLLRRAAPHKTQELDTLIAECNPRFLLDAEEERILFRTNGSANTITIGVKCTCRLQAHSVAGGVFISALSTPGYLKMSPQERGKLYALAEPFLTWAVGRDLRQWLKRNGIERSLEEIMSGSEKELPPDLLASLPGEQWRLGQGLFFFAIAFILLHEFGHLHLEHSGCLGLSSILQEKDADRFAAGWLLDSPCLSGARRLNCLLGMSVALLWLTVFNVFLGPGQSRTHPSGYDRLFQVLDLAISADDEVESLMVWEFVSRLLFVHMDTAGFQFDASRMQGTPREQVNYLVDLLSKECTG